MNRDFAGEQDYVNGYLAANEARLRVFRNFALQIKALRDLGLSKKQIRDILKKEYRQGRTKSLGAWTLLTVQSIRS